MYTSSRMLNSRKTSGISQQKFLNVFEWKIKLTLGQFCLCLLMSVQADSSNPLCIFQSLCCDFHKDDFGRKDHQASLLSFWQFPTSFCSCIFHVYSSDLVTEEYCIMLCYMVHYFGRKQGDKKKKGSKNLKQQYKLQHNMYLVQFQFQHASRTHTHTHTHTPTFKNLTKSFQSENLYCDLPDYDTKYTKRWCGNLKCMCMCVCYKGNAEKLACGWQHSSDRASSIAIYVRLCKVTART